MHILITGGTGLIGLAFIRQHGECQFTVLTRTPEAANSLLPAGVTCINSLDQLQSLDAFDAVINLAGEPIIDKRWSDKQKEIICQSRWHVTKQLVELFARSESPPEVFLSGSAIGVYGGRAGVDITEESLLQGVDFPTKVCIEWERIAEQAQPYTRVVLLRTGIVLASHGGALAKMLLPFKLCLGGPIGQGDQVMSWIHYQDHINAIYFLLNKRTISGAVNLVAPEPQSNSIFTQTLAKVLHRIAIFRMPAALLKVVLGESAVLLLDSQKVLPQKLVDSGFEFQFGSLEPALVNLVGGS